MHESMEITVSLFDMIHFIIFHVFSAIYFIVCLRMTSICISVIVVLVDDEVIIK